VTAPAKVVVIGNVGDPHAAAVLDRVPSDLRPLLIDAEKLPTCQYCLRDGLLTVSEANGREVEIAPGNTARGWIRRLAPPDWQRGLVVESHDAAVKTAWLTLLTSVLRLCGVHWLSSVDELVIAENKLVQYAAASRVGVRVPPTVVTNDHELARTTLAGDILLKPLGPGHFFDGEEPYVVFATVARLDGPELRSLAAAPFIAQRRLIPRSHLRVITVDRDVWAAELSAANRPPDWRADPTAHRSFKTIAPPLDVAGGALAVAKELRLGYTSQDWILADDGPYLLDVNPAGQWLFLPPHVSDSVTAALASWLLTGQHG